VQRVQYIRVDFLENASTTPFIIHISVLILRERESINVFMLKLVSSISMVTYCKMGYSLYSLLFILQCEKTPNNDRFIFGE